MKINKLNYEAFALEYLEGTLSSKERKAMEQFLLKNPAIQAELEEMKDFLVLTPAPIVFENKKQLLKAPARDRIVWVNPWRWTAAASVLLLIAFMLYPEKATIDLVVTNTLEENILETNTTNNTTSTAQVKETNTNQEEEKATTQVDVENVITKREALATKEPFQQKVEKQTATINQEEDIQVEESIANYTLPMESIIKDGPNEIVAHQEEINNQLANNQVSNSKEQQRAAINIDVLENKEIALLKVPMNDEVNEVNILLEHSRSMANVNTPKRRTLKSLIGKLPGNGVKISIIPSFFTD